MKRFFNLIKRTPTLAVFLIILLFYMPIALGYPSETERNSIVSAVGVDKEDGKYSLSLLCFVPQANSTYQEKLQVITCDGKSVSENLEKAGQILGRSVNLNHIETIILSSDVVDEDVAIVLDYFSRSPVVLSSCLLAATSGKAKDAIETIKSLNENSGTKIEEIIRHSETTIYGMETTIESGYYAPLKTSLIGFLELDETGKNSLTASKSQQGQNNQSSSSQGGEESSQSSKKGISNLGKMALLKDGKKELVLDEENIKALNYLKTNMGRDLISLTNTEIENERNADVVYEIVENRVLKTVSFQNGIPFIKYKLRLKVDLFEVLDDENPDLQNIEEYKIDEKINERIEKKIKSEVAKLLSICREKKVDPLGFYEIISKRDKNKFQNFLDMLDDKEDFLSNVVFAISVESETI